MGKRDYRHHEPKKSKKEAKKPLVPQSILPAPVTVEVIKTKGKKAPLFPEEEEKGEEEEE